MREVGHNLNGVILGREFQLVRIHPLSLLDLYCHLDEMHLRMREVGHNLNGVILSQEFQLGRIHPLAFLDLE